MHDDSILAAIDAALRSPTFCACGNNMTIGVHDDAAWLECATFSYPSRLPTRISQFVRRFMHDHRFIVSVPAASSALPGPGAPSALDA